MTSKTFYLKQPCASQEHLRDTYNKQLQFKCVTFPSTNVTFFERQNYSDMLLARLLSFGREALKPKDLRLKIILSQLTGK